MPKVDVDVFALARDVMVWIAPTCVVANLGAVSSRFESMAHGFRQGLIHERLIVGVYTHPDVLERDLAKRKVGLEHVDNER